MPWNTAIPVLIWAIVFAATSVLAWFFFPKDKLTNYLILLDYAVVNLYAMLVVNWAVVNYWLRFLPVIGFIVFFFRTVAIRKRRPWLPRRTGLPTLVLLILILPVAVFFDVRAFQSVTYPKNEGEIAYLAFPLRAGMHVALNGGNGLDGLGLNNYYQDWLGRKTGTDQQMIYSLDVVKMTVEGSISKGILPHDYNDYIGFLEIVYSPCIGTVDYVEDGHHEAKPFSEGEGMGNLIVLKCVDNYITLSNLRNGSIRVKPGDEVNLTSMIAMVGNTANNTYPHLHLQANKGSRDGKPLPMLFDHFDSVDRFIVRNLLTLR
jgi:hypothetical protein